MPFGITEMIGLGAGLASAGAAAAGSASGVGKTSAQQVALDQNALAFGGTTQAQRDIQAQIDAKQRELDDMMRVRNAGQAGVVGLDGKPMHWDAQNNKWVSETEIGNAFNQATNELNQLKGQYQDNSYSNQQQQEQRNVYGQIAKGYGQQALDMQGLAGSSQNRQGTQMDLGQFNQDLNQTRGLVGSMTNIGNDYAESAQGRGAFGESTGLYQQAAEGRGPSAAQAQLQAGKDAAINAQMSAAGSTRGGALALAAAQRNAQNNIATLNQQTANQAAQLRAQEMQSAMAGYAQAQQQAQAGRANAYQAAGGLSSNVAGQAYQAAQGQAALSDAQRARNDAMEQFYRQQQGSYADREANSLQAMYGNVYNLAGKDLAANQQYTDFQMQNANRASQAGQQNAQTDQKFFGGGVNAVSGALGSMIGGK